MKKAIRIAATAVFIPLSVTGCLSSGGTTAGTTTVLVSEITSVCGALVGEQAEQRINQQWAKYPEAEASRSTIETMAEVLLNNPEATGEQNTTAYKKYMTCATGLLVANGAVK